NSQRPALTRLCENRRTRSMLSRLKPSSIRARKAPPGLGAKAWSALQPSRSNRVSWPPHSLWGVGFQSVFPRPRMAGLRYHPSLSKSHRYLPLLLALFVGSGCAALIYEVVWFQLLQLVIGSSALSLGVLLGMYMGGMCLGSLLLPRYIS